MARPSPADWASHVGLMPLITALGGGTRARLVGGAVRDALLGLDVNDLDVATTLLPNEVTSAVTAAGMKAVPTGIAHGTVTVVLEGRPIEVTTLRRDVSTDGRRATVAFTADWQEDARRRDFTINALYADPETGDILDWFGGIADLQARRVRFIGAPLDRIAEDHLRILRFFRFHARFADGMPDADGYAACVARANDLMALSRERIAAELLKLLAVDDPVPTVRLMIDGGILKPVLPEIGSANELERLIGRERDFRMEGDPVRRLAALIGRDAKLASSIAARLKLSKAKTARLTAAAGDQHADGRALAYRSGTACAIDRLLLGDGEQADIDRVAGWTPPRFPLSGGQLIARGLIAGPVVAKTLTRIEDAWVRAGFPTGDTFEAIVASALSEAN